MARAYNASSAMSNYLRIPLACCAGAAALLLALAAVVVGGYYYVEPGLPPADELRDIKLQVPLRIYTRDGRFMAQFGEQRRTPVPYDRIPQRMIDAVLAAEDDRFFEHPGLDYAAIAKAAFNFLSTGGSERVPGGSTITQQVARANFLSRDFNLVRKFKEWILALRIEREFTKQEILGLFLNTMFFGQSSYGVAAAGRTYFDKDLDELDLSEAAIIAGILQGPSIMNPVSSPENAAMRRAYVLRRMRELGMITEAERRQALAEPIVSKRYGPETEVSAPYVAEMVRKEMIRRFGPAAYTAGLKVKTTIDSRLQKTANRAVRETLIAYDERHGYRGPLAHVELPKPGDASLSDQFLQDSLADYPPLIDLQTALVIGVDPEKDSASVYVDGAGRQTIGLDAVQWAARYVNDDHVGARPESVDDVLRPGDIVRLRRADGGWRLAQLPDVQGAFVALDPQDAAISALVGGFDFFLSNYNRATQSRRQPGSAFKPFIYSAALENGFTTATIVNDAPLALDDPVLETVWKPENYGGRFHGPTRLREALVDSLNLVSVRVVRRVGIGNTIRHLRKFGFEDVALPPNPTIALGAGGIAPLDLAAGYAELANGGYRVSPYFIDSVQDLNGDVLYTTSPRIVCRDLPAPPAPQAAAAFVDPAEGDLACPEADQNTDQTRRPEEPALIDKMTDLYPDLRRAKRAISPQNVYLVTDMMHDVVRRGTGVRAWRELHRPDLAGKTGTSNDRRDTWFAGFNADVVATGWVGFDEDRSLGGNEQGSVTALPMWIDFMREALRGQPEHVLKQPSGIVSVRIDPDNGLVASDANRNSIFEKFRIGHVPDREPDPIVDAGHSGDETRPNESGEKIF
jgi:penicillin-binding protein 1A